MSFKGNGLLNAGQQYNQNAANAAFNNTAQGQYYNRAKMSAAFAKFPGDDPVQLAQDAKRHDNGDMVTLYDGSSIPAEFVAAACEAARYKGTEATLLAGTTYRHRAISNHAKTLFVLSQMTEQQASGLEQTERLARFMRAGFWKRIWYALTW